jgi:parallel beta-helix repeat protein
VDGMVVKNSTFKNTIGAPPEDGIDIEPDQNDTVNNVLITGCIFTKNAGDGIQCGVPGAFKGNAFVTNVVIDGNNISSNGMNSFKHAIHNGIHITDCDGTQVKNNTIKNNTGRGICTQSRTHNTTITGNIITGTTFLTSSGVNSGPGKLDGCGIWLAIYTKGSSDCLGSSCTGNTVTANSGIGIYQDPGCGATVSGNTVNGNL